VSKWQLLSFIFYRGSRKVKWMGDDSHAVFGKKSLVKKELPDYALS
jgi:hypothetical protein